MALDQKFTELTSNLIYQKLDDYAKEQSLKQAKILNDAACKGFSMPPGYVYGAFDDIQIESVRDRKDIIWSVLEETFEAFNFTYYPELATDILEFCEDFFPESLCEPHGYMKSMGYTRPYEEKVNTQFKEELGRTRHTALHRLKTKIDLYTTNLQSKLASSSINDEAVVRQEKITVLFIASNPMDLSQLRLDEEIRSITDKIRKSDFRDSVDLKSFWATRPTDLLQAINEYKPTIVHFSGHGSNNDELVLQDNSGNKKMVSMRSIVELFKVSASGIKLVVFNTCSSANQANEIVKYVQSAIGMNTSIGDEAARIFSAQLYSAISFGKSIQESFDQAKVALMLENIPEHQTPQLFVQLGINECDLVLVR